MNQNHALKKKELLLDVRSGLLVRTPFVKQT